MANTSDWGRIYCFTEFGNEDATIPEAIRFVSIPSCFESSIVNRPGLIPFIDTMALTVDDTATYRADNNVVLASQTLIN